MKNKTLGSLIKGDIFLFGNVVFVLEVDPKESNDETLMCSFMSANQMVYISRVAIINHLR